MAKYMPQSKLWLSKRDYRCSVFWKAIMRLREFLLPLVSWQIGSGGKCEALAQPWFEGALNCIVIEARDRNLKVQDLLDSESGAWDITILIRLFGHQACVQIIATVNPPSPHASQDRLIFLPNTNGQFSVKKAYQLLRKENISLHLTTSADKALWRVIWHKGNALPRTRLFLWKVMHSALPLAKVLVSRCRRGNPGCLTYGEGEEDVVHMLFHCNFARSCWLAHDLGLRSGELPVGIRQGMLFLNSQCDESQWSHLIAGIWSLWRVRNDLAYSGKAPTYQQFLKYYSAISIETSYAKYTSPRKVAPTDTHSADPSQLIPSSFCYFSDGSWTKYRQGGIGFVCFDKGELLVYASVGRTARCPAQAEALALTLVCVIQQGVPCYNFFTDSLM